MSFCLTIKAQTYTFPSEELPHEGTWLQWPHQYQYGLTYRNRLDTTWVAMSQALVTSEKVHIIAYDATEQTRITNLLTSMSVPLTNIDFKVFPTDDVWVRDNGPIFVKNSSNQLMIQDWGFNAWGGKFQFNNCNPIPTLIATSIGAPIINLNSTMVNEGGSVELDGAGVLMACRSSILSQSPANTVRNVGMTQAQAETIFTNNLGVTKFIWLNGVTGLEVTDMHIDGFARFGTPTTIVTMSQADLLNWGVPQADIDTLMAAKNVSNVPYNFTIVPLTQNNVTTTYGIVLPYKGSYCNYYVGNTKVLVPNYNDPNDATANAIIGALYPGRTVVGIDVRNLYANGGMVHCVTQQQPLGTFTPLPITLSSFKAECMGSNNTQLRWTTEMESNNDRFEIEKSIDGKNYTTIATVKGNFNSSVTQQYQFNDNKVFQRTNFYRLKQIDVDGKYEYSNIVSTYCNTSNQVQIIPNPASQTIQLTGIQSAKTIEIINAIGCVVYKKENLKSTDIVNVSNLTSGLYMVLVKDKFETIALKLSINE